MSELVSFIFVNRGGVSLNDAIRNVKQVYSDYDKEILVIEQADDLPFLRGQLFNIGVKFAQGTYIALSDNDMYHLNKVPWIHIYEKIKKPLIGFKYICQVTLKNGTPIITKTEECPTGFGGFNFMRRSDFLWFNGFSNLFVGWGFEDNAYSTRFQYVRVPNWLGHITHPIRNYTYVKNREYNLELWKTVSSRDSNLDGIQQTTFNLVSDEVDGDGIRHICVNKVSVCDGFAYSDLLKKHYTLLDIR